MDDPLLRAWMAQIRAEADRKRAEPPDAGPRLPPFNWPQLNVALGRAARGAASGADLPAAHRSRNPLRHLFRLARRVALHLVRPVTVRQDDFNRELLQIVRDLGTGVRDLERKVDRQAERLCRLEAALRQAEARKAS